MRSSREPTGLRSVSSFSLKLQTVLVHLRCDDLIVEKKPRPADPADATTPAGIIAAASVATWVQQNKVAMAAIRGNTEKSFYSYVWRADHMRQCTGQC